VDEVLTVEEKRLLRHMEETYGGTPAHNVQALCRLVRRLVKELEQARKEW
jgi:hypothetical protein